MKLFRPIILLPIFILALNSQSCKVLVNAEDNEPVARVFDKYLYKNELLEAIPEGTTLKDSAVIARSIIDTWIRNQLMLHIAEEELTDEQKDVEQKIEEYRSSLLIYTYRQKLLQQKLDTVVQENEIQEYYDSNIENFILNGEIVKAIFLKVPLTSPQLSNVRNWMRSASTDDLDQLEKYSINYADKFDVFNNNWIYFSTLMERVPMNIQQPARYLRYNRNIETTDSLYHYFVHISDYKAEGETSPLDLIRDDLKSILLNKRKIEFYNSLDKRIYNDASSKKQFEIF